MEIKSVECEENVENGENEDEIYCVNWNKDLNTIFYGGKDHSCTLLNTSNDLPEASFTEFEDSVVFCSQLEDNLFLVCTIEGSVVLTTDSEIVNLQKLEEDITFVDVVEDKIMIGGSQGTIYIYSKDLSTHNVYLGHSGDIQKIVYANNAYYALSETQFIAFDEFSFQHKYKKNLKGATVFEGIPNTEIFCIGKEGEIIILKNGFILNKWEIEGTPECVILSNDHFIVGGSFPYLFIINIKMNMKEYKIRLEIEGCTKIQSIEGNTIALSTMCGLLGVGDIRKDDSFEFKSSGVGPVFDFVFVNGKFYAGGLEGFEIV